MQDFNYQIGFCGKSDKSEAFIRNLTMNGFSLSIYSKEIYAKLLSEGFTCFDRLDEMLDNLLKLKIVFVSDDDKFNNHKIIVELLNKLPKNSVIIDLHTKSKEEMIFLKKLAIRNNITYFIANFLCSNKDIFYNAEICLTSSDTNKFNEFVKIFKTCFKCGLHLHKEIITYFSFLEKTNELMYEIWLYIVENKPYNEQFLYFEKLEYKDFFIRRVENIKNFLNNNLENEKITFADYLNHFDENPVYEFLT